MVDFGKQWLVGDLSWVCCFAENVLVLIVISQNVQLIRKKTEDPDGGLKIAALCKLWITQSATVWLVKCLVCYRLLPFWDSICGRKSRDPNFKKTRLYLCDSPYYFKQASSKKTRKRDFIGSGKKKKQSNNGWLVDFYDILE